jgi:hypothetical protein
VHVDANIRGYGKTPTSIPRTVPLRWRHWTPFPRVRNCSKRQGYPKPPAIRSIDRRRWELGDPRRHGY